MSTPLRNVILEFIAELRAAGVRVSVAESIDAMNAVAAAGLRRTRLREALRAALIKDESDGDTFATVFDRRFGLARPAVAPGRSQGTQIGVSGSGRGDGGGASITHPAREEPLASKESASAGRTGEAANERPTALPQGEPDATQHSGNGNPIDAVVSGHESSSTAASTEREDAAADGIGAGDRAAPGELGRAGHTKEIELIPFANYTSLEFDTARDTLGLLKRRLRVRLSRRLRMAGSGRIDFRRTIRAGIQSGGRFADLRFRMRRPRHIDLLLLTDISGSVKYASTLMLDLAAGVRECFRRVRSFVYVDRIAEASFEQGHLVMEPIIDLYARSDFGHVLAEIWERRASLLNRATLVVIMGDGRNNRRPARVDLLRDIARRCRGVWWLNPEPPERWNTGDSDIGRYAREVVEMVECGNLRELERTLGRVA